MKTATIRFLVLAALSLSAGIARSQIVLRDPGNEIDDLLDAIRGGPEQHAEDTADQRGPAESKEAESGGTEVAPAAPAPISPAPVPATPAPLPGGRPPPSGLASRDIGDPEANLWQEGNWPTTAGEISVLDETPSGSAAPDGRKALRLTVHYGALSFGGWSARPRDQRLPGRVVKVTGWARGGNADSWNMTMSFVDANSNSFSYAIPAKPFEWTPFEFPIPEMVSVKNRDGEVGRAPVEFPIKFDSISQHNWADRNNPEAVDRILDVYDLRVHTDVSGIPVEERPCSIDVSFPAVANCFYDGEEKPEIRLYLGSWLGETRRVRTVAEVESSTGEKRGLEIPAVDLLDNASLRVPLPFAEPGSYTVRLRATGLPRDFEAERRYAVILHPPALSETQKKDSPYGINVHGAAYVGYDRFAKLGFVWVRDYAFVYKWMVRARGDGKYAGWPWYPKIFAGAAKQGLLMLPVLHGSISSDRSNASGTPAGGPTAEWRANLGNIFSTFDGQSVWELDNECDGAVGPDSDLYGEYHGVFAQGIHFVNPEHLAVQEGSADIRIEAIRRHVLSGAFRGIDVCNGHRYCGTEPPERSTENFNVVSGTARRGLLRDVFRKWKEAACADGRRRQVWLTEWGYDTRAGHVVAEEEQAAYLQREWVLGMGNGVDKMFWYWNYDSDTPNPEKFFDGCGVFDRFREPKPAAPAFAALRTFLPADAEYLGYANLSPNHMAHVLKSGGRIVALAFKIRKNGPDLAIEDPKADEIRDMYGKKLRPGCRTLGVAPVWYLGLDGKCEWMKQLPFDLSSDFMPIAGAGDRISVRFSDPAAGEWSLDLPEGMKRSGWSCEPVRDGGSGLAGFDVVSPADAAAGNYEVTVVGRNGSAEKRIPVTILIEKP